MNDEEKNTLRETAENHVHGHRGRLRDKFHRSGAIGLHDYEMVELLLTFAIPRRDVKPLAKSLIKRFNGLRAMLDAPKEALMEVPGIGERAATLIGLVKSMGTAYLEETVIRGDAIRSPDDVVKFLTAKLSGERIEKFLALYLNSKGEVIALETINEGTLDQTMVYPRKVIEHAFKHNARSIILVHNHPSGDSTPSNADRKLTKDLERAARSLDIRIHDHLIIGKHGHYSMRDHDWPI